MRRIFEKVQYTDLKVGDEFTWLDYPPDDNRNFPPYYTYTLTANNVEEKWINFFDTTNTNRKWIGYKTRSTAENRLYRVLKLSKEEQIINKIKYLNKRYMERKVA